MPRYKLFALLCAAHFVIAVGCLWAQENAEPTLRIDIPTKLERANVAIDFGHAAFAAPHISFALGDINLLATDVRDWNAKGQIVVIFHGDAAMSGLRSRRLEGSPTGMTGSWSAVLSLHAELAVDYFELRSARAIRARHRNLDRQASRRVHYILC